MNEQMQKQFHRRQYPLVRYLGLLLAVALLFTGVTFARYATNTNIPASVGIAAFDVDYTIEGINSTTFGNMDYWQSSGGTWLAQGAGSARTVRIQFKNNGGVAVQPTLRLSGPADFWENIALQIAQGTTKTASGSGEQVDASSAFAGESISTQYVFADLLRVREGGVNVGGDSPAAGEETHNYTYNDYINWDTDNWDTEPANGATQDQEGVCVFDTKFSDQFGQRESSNYGMIGEKLQMSGGFQLSDDEPKFEKDTLTVTRTEKYYKDTDGTITEVPEDERYPMTMTIKAEMREVEYSVGYARKEGNHGLPALYLDCQKSMPYYTIEIKADRLVLKPGETKTVILFMTWTNSVTPAELSDNVQIEPGSAEGSTEEPKINYMTNLLDSGGELYDKDKKLVTTVLGYHFNDTAVPVCDKEGKPISENGEPQLTTVRITNTFGESGISTSYEHIASLSGDDSPFAHPMEQHSGTIYKCSNTGTATTYVDINNITKEVDASTVAYDMSEAEDGVTRTYTVASEIGYTTDFRVVLEQASEVPAAQQP